jgi:hypothetical protein
VVSGHMCLRPGRRSRIKYFLAAPLVTDWPRRERNLPDQPGGDAEDLVTLARKAHDLDAVRKSVEDAASVKFFNGIGRKQAFIQ